MTKKITSSFILIILMMNLFFEMSVSHHVHAETQDKSSQQISFELDHRSDNSHHTQSTSDHCANGVCHSGFCKLLNMNDSITVTRYELVISYHPTNQLLPESPYLFANRRPPKTLA